MIFPCRDLARHIFGRLFGGKGYISASLAERLFLTHELRLMIKLRKNMRNILPPYVDKLLQRKPALIETIVDQLNNMCQIDHSRHRSPTHFLVHLLAGLAAYCHLPEKPSLHRDLRPLLAAWLIQDSRPLIFYCPGA
jgi:hypothetical protein